MLHPSNVICPMLAFTTLLLLASNENCAVFGFILRDSQSIEQQWLHHPVRVFADVPSIGSSFGRHQSKRMADFAKRERIIMDALGGNDFLIKRSNADRIKMP